MKTLLTFFLTISLTLFSMGAAPEQIEVPWKVGDHATDFTLHTVDGSEVQLSKLTAKGKVVIVILRGWLTLHQCMYSVAQMNDFMASTEAFKEEKATVLMVYPGPAQNLKIRAAAFLKKTDKIWPQDFFLVLDPDSKMADSYGLKWDLSKLKKEDPRENAHPAVLIIDEIGKIRFAKVSQSIEDRLKATEVIAELKKLKSP